MAPPAVHVHEDDRRRGLLSKAEVPSPASVICSNPKCGARIPPEAKFCMMCGTKRPAEKPTPATDAAETEGREVVHSFRNTVWLFFHHEDQAKAKERKNERSKAEWLLRHSEKYEMFSILLVIYLVLADILMSIKEMANMFAHTVLLVSIEAGIYALFTMEYSLRVWSCMESPVYAELGPCKGRRKLMSGVIEMVDLVVLLAYYVNYLPGFKNLKGLSALRMIRLLRVAALLKVERKTSSFSKIVSVLKTKKSELIATLFTAAVLMIMSATTMYYIENEAQPVAFGSVPDAMWWSVTALTTVGYGDVVPQTPAGKVLGSIVAFFGVGLFALPAGILGSGFVEEVDKAKRDAQAELELPGDEDMEEDIGQELVSDEEKQAKMIEAITENVQALRGTVAGLQNGQQQIVNLVQRICPKLEVQSTMKLDGVRSITDVELTALQESVATKLDRICRRS